MPDNALDHLARLTKTLRHIANHGDCHYLDEPDKPNPCNCPVCAAKAALTEDAAWRYRGGRHQRATNGFNPREAAIVKAWAAQVDDRKLAMILAEQAPTEEQRHFVFHEYLQPPTARDWYVATTVVQWLATNVGQGVLRDAGWEYMRYAEDRVAVETKRAAEAPLATAMREGAEHFDPPTERPMRCGAPTGTHAREECDNATPCALHPHYRFRR